MWRAIYLEPSKPTFKPSTLTLKKSELTFKESEPNFKKSMLTLKESTSTFKESELTFKKSMLTLKESTLTFKESSLTFKPSALTFKKSERTAKPVWIGGWPGPKTTSEVSETSEVFRPGRFWQVVAGGLCSPCTTRINISMNAWLITWEGTQLYKSKLDKIVAILSSRKPQRIVIEFVELLYLRSTCSASSMAYVANRPKDIVFKMCKAPSINGILYPKRFFCGSSEFMLYARHVTNLKIHVDKEKRKEIVSAVIGFYFAEFKKLQTTLVTFKSDPEYS
jgi:hypothetical protein